jgi:hypothetical protein
VTERVREEEGKVGDLDRQSTDLKTDIAASAGTIAETSQQRDAEKATPARREQSAREMQGAVGQPKVREALLRMEYM